MTDQTPGASIAVNVLSSLDQIAQADWDACACPETADGGRPDDPFTTWRFLHALEASGSVGRGTGWEPRYLSAELDGEIIAVAPLYAKGHSQGEYIFDHNWAHAFENAGGRYYPKLQVSVPFTPATGPRLLVSPGKDQEKTRQLLIRAATQVADKLGVSSLNVTFTTESEWRLMGNNGLLQRTGEQFHWENAGYQNFDEFLSSLTSRKRKSIRKERARAASGDVKIEIFTGDSLQTKHWDAFFHFYTDTGNRKWGTAYLTRDFFDLIHERMSENIALVMCQRGGRVIRG